MEVKLRVFALRSNGKTEEVRPPGGRDFFDVRDAEVRARIVSFQADVVKAWVTGETVIREYQGAARLAELLAKANAEDVSQS